MLRLEAVRHAWAGESVLADISFELTAGQIGCLLGPSGCGKTTILRLIAGFLPLQGGEIRLAGDPVSGAGVHLAAERRQIGIVFQDYALFTHLDVARNVAFGLRHLAAAARRARVAEMLELVGLAAQAGAYPHELSGGQQQRVALARALAPRPRLLMLDEPFSSLDVELREKLSLEVRDILRHEQITTLIVTHDQYEAFALADRVGVLNDGRILQWDAPYALYHQPRDRFVADFIGQGVFMPGEVDAHGNVVTELGVLSGIEENECDGERCDRLPPGARVQVLIRPDDIQHDDASPMKARVVRKAFRGAEFLYTLQFRTGQHLLALVPSHHNHAIGEEIGIVLAIDHVVAFREDR